MKKRILVPLVLTLAAILLGSFGYFNGWFSKASREDYVLDIEGIRARGTLRVAVDNNSSSYYIYRGRRMGYEYELMLDLGKRLGLQLEFIVVADMDQAFIHLQEGKVDLIAMNLQQDNQQVAWVTFTQPIGTLNSVLVGKTPQASWQSIGNDTIVVRKGTVYKAQLQGIKDSLGLAFTIKETGYHEETLIDQVEEGQISWTVAERTIGQINATYYENVFVSLGITKEAPVAWALRNSSPELAKEVNIWLTEKKKRFMPDLYKRYFLNVKNQQYFNSSDYSSLGGKRISAYDELIEKNAETLGWDWRLLAALVYKESRFDTTAISYAGARGLLQLMPVTLERFGVTNPNDPEESLQGGVRYLKYLDKFWLERIPETNERIKFILASYNIGQGHVEDAWRLTLKYGKNTQRWQEVSVFLSLKSDPIYYRDPVVKSGYAKGQTAVNYVRDVLSLFDSYKALVAP